MVKSIAVCCSSAQVVGIERVPSEENKETDEGGAATSGTGLGCMPALRLCPSTARAHLSAKEETKQKVSCAHEHAWGILRPTSTIYVSKTISSNIYLPPQFSPLGRKHQKPSSRPQRCQLTAILLRPLVHALYRLAAYQTMPPVSTHSAAHRPEPRRRHD